MLVSSLPEVYDKVRFHVEKLVGEGPSLETSNFASSFQAVKEPNTFRVLFNTYTGNISLGYCLKTYYFIIMSASCRYFLG